MRHPPRARRLLYPALLLVLGPGCAALQRARPVAVLARDADTGKPIPGAEVRLSYPLAQPLLAPPESSATTGDDGIARLRAVPCGDTRIMLDVAADGYLPEHQFVSAEAVRAIAPAHLFEAVGRRPVSFVVDLYADSPVPTIEFVVPAGYRGLIQAELVIADDAPCQPGQRCFRYVVPPSGVVRVTAPALLRRFPLPAFGARYADGTPLSRGAKGAEVGLWQVKSDGPSYTFLVGTEDEYAQYHPPRQGNPGEQAPPSGGGKGRGRGRGGRRGNQPPADS